MPTPHTLSLGYLLIDEASPSVTEGVRATLPSGRPESSGGPWSVGCAGSEQGEHTSGSPGLAPTPCVSIAGTEGPEEGAAPGTPQVRASPGPARQERPGGPRPRRGAGAPGRALAPTPACREDTLRVPYQSVTLKSKLSPTLSVGNHILPPQLETRSSNNGDPSRAVRAPPPIRGPRTAPRKMVPQNQS